MRQLCAEFKAVGVSEYARHKYGGNYRAMSVNEEVELLEFINVKLQLIVDK